MRRRSGGNSSLPGSLTIGPRGAIAPPMALYDDALTMRAARRLYFDANGFGEGGYDAKWVTVKMGPIPFAFPNSPERVRSVRLHDLHHVVTDYATDWTGEAEIGAWE